MLPPCVPPVEAEPTELTYGVFGLIVSTNRSIPGLEANRLRGGSVRPRTDVHLVVHDVPAWVREASERGPEPFYVSAVRGPSGAPALLARALDRGVLFQVRHWDGTECFIDRTGERLWLSWPADGVDDPYEFLLGHVMGFVLRLRGSLCLHAAAVAGRGGGVLAIAGRPGVGKSTLVAALASRGYPVLTDDVAAVMRDADGSFVLHPGPARLRPRRAGLTALAASSPAVHWVASPLPDCVDIDLSQPGLTHAREAGRLQRVCFLESRPNCVAAELGPISHVDAVIALSSDTWARRLQSRQMQQQEFQEMGRLLTAVLPIRATYSPGSDWIAALIPHLACVLDTL